MVMTNILKITSLIFLTQSCIYAQPLANINHVGPTHLHDAKVAHVSIVGPALMNTITANSINITGSLGFKALTVEGDAVITGAVEKSSDGQFGHLRVTGTVEATDIHCNELSVTGPATLADAHVTEHSTFFGPLKTSGCTFKTMTITANKIELNDTKTTTIVIKEDNSGPGFLSWALNLFKREVADDQNSQDACPEVLTLSGNSKVDGNITFESKRGHVIIMPNALVRGTIIGATIERR